MTRPSSSPSRQIEVSQTWRALASLVRGQTAVRLLSCVVALGALACSSRPDECSCAGTSDCLALCMCSGEGTAECESDCGEAFPEYTEPEVVADDAERIEALALLLNEVRSTGGCCAADCFEPLGAFADSAELNRAAKWHASDMAARGYISHETPEGLDAVTRIRRAGYQGCAVGENISAGDDDPEVVLGEFLGSYEHCLNVFEPRFSEIGTALVRSEDGEPYWVLTFGGK